MTNKNVKLYNLVFPIWALCLIPVTWIVVLPANFIIDLLVIVITLTVLKVDNIKSKAKSAILKVWIFGFIADFIGTALMFAPSLIEMKKEWQIDFSNAVNYNPFVSIYAFLWVTLSVVVTCLFIYLFNCKICLKKLDMEDSKKKKLALSIAIFTAPILFYIPTPMGLYH